MAQKLNLQGGSPALYTMGGVRLWFNRQVDPDTTPPKYEGYRDLGNIVDAPSTVVKETKEHFSSRFGNRRRDYRLTDVVGEDIDIQFDELSFNNVLKWFNGESYFTGGTTDVVPTGAGVVVTDEIVQLVEGFNVPLGRGHLATAIVVKTFDGITTAVLNTDYTLGVDDIGHITIARKTASVVIVTGDFVRVSYTYSKVAHMKFSPWIIDPAVQIGKAIMFCVSKKGVEFARRWDFVELEADGAFNYAQDNWTAAKFKMRVDDNSAVDVNLPFGVFEYYGLDAKLYKTGA